jgi:hypothetical protein
MHGQVNAGVRVRTCRMLLPFRPVSTAYWSEWQEPLAGADPASLFLIVPIKNSIF